MGFARQVLLTFGARVGLLPLGVVTGVVVARWLGPEGQGLWASIGAYIAMAATIASLGLSPALTRAAAAEPEAAPTLAANARTVGAALGLGAAAIVLALRAAFPAAFGDVPFSVLAVAALALPFTLAASQMQAVLVGLRRIRQATALDVVDRAGLFVAVLVLVLGLGLGVPALVAATVVLAAARFGTAQVMLGSRLAGFRPDLGRLRGLAGISLRAWLVTLLSFLVLRSDLALAQALVGSAPTGVYSIAVQIADLLLVLPGAVGAMLLPRIASGEGGPSAEMTASACRHTVLVVTASVIVAAAGARWIVPLVFGDGYAYAVVCLWVLLPGVWCLALELVLVHDLAGRDYPLFLIWMWAGILVLNVLLNLAWLPRYGVVGAAASSTIAYALALVALLHHWRRRFPAVGLMDLLVLRRDEWRELPTRFRARGVQGRAS